MKKYSIHFLFLLVIVFGTLFFTQIYKSKFSDEYAMKNKIEELQEKVIELENNSTEQSQIINGLKGEIVQTKDEQIKKLEDSVVELQEKISSTKELESRLLVVEKNISNLKVSAGNSAGTAYLFGKAMDATAKLAR